MAGDRAGWLVLVAAAGSLMTAPAAEVYAQSGFAAPPDSLAIRSIRGLRSENVTTRSMATAAISHLLSEGHLQADPALARMLADSVLAVAATHINQTGRADAFYVMRLLDDSGSIFPVSTWAHLVEREQAGALRLTLLRTLAENRDSAAAATAITEVAIRHGDSPADVLAAIEHLDALEQHGKAGLIAMWESPRVIVSKARRSLDFIVADFRLPLPAWTPGGAYAVGDRVSYGDHDFQCRRAHTAQPGSEPPNAYTDWARINTGASWWPQVLYKPGDEVVFDGGRYRALQPHQSQDDQEPPTAPTLWRRIPSRSTGPPQPRG
jgi:hypothetical protein